MTTIDEIVKQLKIDNPTIKVGSEEIGYTELSPEEYEATILEWAKNMPAPEPTKEELEIAEAEKLAQRQSLLDKLGITEEEAKLLLS